MLASDGPLSSFRANLLPDKHYLTAGHLWGSSNQVVGTLKLILLALETDRVPILDSFDGSHHSEGAEAPWSQFYDLDRLSRTIDLPILEWYDVKTADSGEDEPLTCWHSSDWVPDGAEQSLHPWKIKPDFWPVPPEFNTGILASIKALAVLQSTEEQKGDDAKYFDGYRGRAEADGQTVPATRPDSQLLCFDQLFFECEGWFENGALTKPETDDRIDPGAVLWQHVGRHLHWNDDINALADEFLTATLGRAGGPFLAVHLRQGDFVWYNRVGDKAEAPFVDALEDVKRALAAKDWAARAPAWAGKWRKPLPVVFATDSDDPEYIAALEARGWHYLDHSAFRTAERFGGWYPSMLDLAVMSRAVGFVGTEKSTFSAITANRVISWQDGVARLTS